MHVQPHACHSLPNDCSSWILCTTVLWGLSQAAKLALTIASYTPEFSGLHWPYCRLSHWYLFIYKSSLSLLPSYLGRYIVRKTSNYLTTPFYCPFLWFALNLANRPFCSLLLQPGTTCRQSCSSMSWSWLGPLKMYWTAWRQIQLEFVIASQASSVSSWSIWFCELLLYVVVF